MTQERLRLLVGYDPKTERVAYRQEIPESKVAEIISWVRPDADDQGAIDSYPIDNSLVGDIIKACELPRGDSALEYFFESRALVNSW